MGLILALREAHHDRESFLLVYSVYPVYCHLWQLMRFSESDVTMFTAVILH